MMAKIERYEVMDRATLGRLMLDMTYLVQKDEGWEPVGGVVVDYHLYIPSTTMGLHGTSYKYAVKKRYLQAVIKRSEGGE